METLVKLLEFFSYLRPPNDVNPFLFPFLEMIGFCDGWGRPNAR